ncbi:hypothetical protein I4U23_020839 [Adineta vaga]|nr:hypothetical protein I4U23_020839 [Adineta vaga]
MIRLLNDIPTRLSKQCLLTLRDDNALLCPIAIEIAFQSITFSDKTLINKLKKNISFQFYNYFLLNQNSIESFDNDFNEDTSKDFNTEFHRYNLTDFEERKKILNQLLNHFSDQTFQSSQKFLNQIIIESITLISCSSLIFRPLKSEYWEQLGSLKFHSNLHLSTETEFYFTKGFFRIAFHQTFQKIEIPGQTYNGIQMKLILLLPRCSSDLVHLYANLNEYLQLPFSLAFISVCIPNISMDIDMNLTESLKMFHDIYNLNNLTKQNETNHLSAAYSLVHFVLDMTLDRSKQSSRQCLHSIDLSPITPWVFFANHPFIFLITYDDSYLFLGHMLSPKIHSKTRQTSFSPKLNTQ